MNNSHADYRIILRDKLIVDILLVDDGEDGYRFMVWSDVHCSRPIIDERNLLNKDITWTPERLEGLIFELLAYEVGNPRTRIPQSIFDALDLKFSQLAYSGD